MDLKDPNYDGIFNSGVSGTPTNYDKTSNSILLGMIPNWSQDSSLELTFQRGSLYFDYATGKFTDGTGSTASLPGFDSKYHELIPLWNAYDYAIANGKQNATLLMNKILLEEKALRTDYALRSRDERTGFRPRNESCR